MNLKFKYKQKYLKYKSKYLNLIEKNNLLTGGVDNYYKNSYTLINMINLKLILDDEYPLIQKLFIFNDDKLAIFNYNENNYNINFFQVIKKEDNNKYDINILKNFYTEYNEYRQNPMLISKFIQNKIAINNYYTSCISIYDISGYLNKLSLNDINKNSIDKNDRFKNITCSTQLTNGNIVVCDYNESYNIKIINFEGVIIKKFSISNDNKPMITCIIQLSNENIALCNNTDSCVLIINMDGILLQKIDINNLYNIDNDFERDISTVSFTPNYIIQLENDDLAVLTSYGSNLDPFNIKNYVMIFDSYGNYIDKITHKKFNFILSLDKLSNNDLVICNGEDLFFYKRNIIYANNIVNIQDILCNINLYLNQNDKKTFKIKYYLNNNQIIFNYFIEIEITYSTYNKNDNLLQKKQKNNINIFDELFLQKEILDTPSYVKFILNNEIKGKQYEKFNIEEFNTEQFNTEELKTMIFDELTKFLIDKYFQEDSQTNLYSLYINSKELEYYQKLYFIGQLFGLAIILNQSIKINLNPILLYEMTHNLIPDNINEELINLIIKNYTSEQKLFEYYNSKSIEEIINYVKITQEVNRYFIDGFRQQINIYKSKINLLSLKLLNELITKEIK